MDKDVKQLIAGSIPHLSIWVLAIVMLLFFKTPGRSCKCECNEKQLPVCRLGICAEGTNFLTENKYSATNLWSAVMYITVTNRTETP